jgi:hypothetical protein
MKKIFVVVVLALFAVGLAYAEDFALAKKLGPYSVRINMDKNPPVVGANKMKIEIKDDTGAPVADAKVNVAYSMPGMPGMPPMNYKSDATFKGELYETKLDLSMPGSWNVAVKVSRAGKAGTIKFNVDAH